MQLVCELTSQLQRRWHHDDSVRLLLEYLVGGTHKGIRLEPLVIDHLDGDAEVTPPLAGCLCTFLNLFPIGFAGMFGNDAPEGVLLVVGQCRGIHIGLVVHLLQRLVDLLESLGADVRAIV